MVNRALSGELDLAAGVLPVKANAAGRERNAQMVGLRVLELLYDGDLLRCLASKALVEIEAVSIAAPGPVVHILASDGHIRRM
jgi:hypothetical protein